MNKEEIKKILPHREPMLLVDEVELIDGVAHGKCHIRGDEYFLQGHFPGNPVVPGVIQCEMMAQSACVLLASGAGHLGDRVRNHPAAGQLLLCQGQGLGQRQGLRQRGVLLRPGQIRIKGRLAPLRKG